MSRSKSEKLIWIESVVSNPPEGCAIWPFPRFNTGGYGGICYQGRTHNAHRVALMLATGVNPKGLVAGHGPCHNPACCNPNHLSWLTHSENQNDRLRDGTETRSPLTD